MADVALFVGVDGGATKTVAVAVDGAGQERGRGTAAGSNYAVVGLERAIERIREAVAEAARTAGARLPVHSALIGLAGVDRDADRDAHLPHLRSLAGLVRITNDAELALSALPGGVGVAVIGGTGAIMLGRDAGGATARAGGWGHIIGDEGSGYDLGRHALHAAVRAADGRDPATALLPAILDFWQLAEPSDIVGRVYHRSDKADIAKLSKLVFAAAREGDAVARKLVDRAAAELALGAVVVGDKLAFADGRLPLALTGGLLVGEADLRASVLRRVRRRRPVGPVAVVADVALSAARAAVDLR